MPPLAPLPSPASRRSVRRIVGALVLAGAVATTAACGADNDDATASPEPPLAAGLVILSGDPGAARLTVHDGSGTGQEMDLPDPATAWVSAGRGGTLIATLEDGTLSLSDRIRADAQPSWTPVPGEDTDVPEDPLYFATWSPNGERVVAIASDFADAGRLTLAVVDPTGDASLLLPVPRQPVVAGPAWIDDERVLVQTTVGFVIVDTATGDVGLGPQDDLGVGIGLAIAADGSVVAIAPEAGLVELRERDRWLAGDAGGPTARIEGQGEIGVLAFDRRGERLAIVWQRPDGPGILTIHRRSDGWAESDRRTLPGESARAVVDWLP